MYAYGTHHAGHTEESLAEASPLCDTPVAQCKCTYKPYNHAEFAASIDYAHI